MYHASAAEYVMLPWSIRGPLIRKDDGTVRYEMRVDELPDFVVSASTEGGVLYAFKRALHAFIEAALRRGANVPRPAGPPVHYAVPPRVQVAAPTKVAGAYTGSPIAVGSVKL